MKIVFENESFIALEKEAGWLTTPGRIGEKDSRPVLGIELQRLRNQQIFPIHRLDFEVSGLVLFALSAKAHSEANSLFENKKVQKVYQALTENKNPSSPPLGTKLEWKSKILRGKKRAYESPHGKPSLTFARCLGQQGSDFEWELKPVTGRSHQLRFDVSRHGYPIVGDVLYGAAKRPDIAENEIKLKSVQIEFLEDEFLRRWNMPKILKVTQGLF